MNEENEVVERDDIVCACGSRRVRTAVQHRRRPGEIPTVFAQCIICGRHWHFAADAPEPLE